MDLQTKEEMQIPQEMNRKEKRPEAIARRGVLQK